MAAAAPLTVPVTVDELCGRFAVPRKPDAMLDWSLVYPPLQAKYRVGLEACLKEGAHYYATCGTRTYKQQMDLYLQGRKTPGPHAGEANYPVLGLCVTKARPGQSDHNFGIALDSTRDSDTARAGLQPDYNIAHYEPLARNMKRVGLVPLFYSAEFREGPHVALDIESRGISRRVLQLEFERRGLSNLKNGLLDVWSFLDRHGPW